MAVADAEVFDVESDDAEVSSVTDREVLGPAATERDVTGGEVAAAPVPAATGGADTRPNSTGPGFGAIMDDTALDIYLDDELSTLLCKAFAVVEAERPPRPALLIANVLELNAPSNSGERGQLRPLAKKKAQSKADVSSRTPVEVNSYLAPVGELVAGVLAGLLKSGVRRANLRADLARALREV